MSSGEQKGWFARNWIWLVTGGCLGSIVLVVGFVLAIVFFVFGVIKSTDVYQQGLAKAKASPGVVSVLGEPVQEAWYVSGQIKNGRADIQIPVSGPKKSGTINVVGVQKGDTWEYSKVELVVDGESKRVNILAGE